MYKKMIMFLCFPITLYGAVAYIPQALRECITMVHNLDKKSGNHNVEELYAMIRENRVLASDDMVRKAVVEALDVLRSNKNEKVQKQSKAIKKYLEHYLHSLDNTFVLLSLSGSESQRTSWPMPLIARSLHGSLRDLDMICLSSELTAVQSMELCGNADMNFSPSLERWFFMFGNNPKLNDADDPSIGFNANMMTNSVYTMPNTIFGTGVSAPIINAWAMSTSNLVQSPINMQFAVPGNFAHKKPVSLELHFLVTQQSGNGNAAIKVNAKYMKNHSEFDIFDAAPVFTSTNVSNDFAVTEPSSSHNVEHIVVTVPLDSSGIFAHNFALLSLTRVAPTSGVEYPADIYLAAASFIYTSTDSSWFFW
jgi:hypothetical protein